MASPSCNESQLNHLQLNNSKIGQNIILILYLTV